MGGIGTPYGPPRMDLAAQFGPTVESCEAIKLADGVGVAVTFQANGYRAAVRARNEVEAVDALRQFISEFPHGRRRSGQAWMPR